MEAALLWLFGLWWLAAVLVHPMTALLALSHFRCRPVLPAGPLPPVSVLVPMRGLDPELAANVEALFAQAYPEFEVLASVADPSDPAIGLVRSIMARHPERQSQFLAGDLKVGVNPKIQNLMRSYEAARHDFILQCDSNVQLEAGALAGMMAQLTTETALLSAAVVAVRPANFTGELECAMTNGYGARWQGAAAALGIGIAIGKVLFFRKSDLDRAGGLAIAANHPCEDRAIEGALLPLRPLVVTATIPAWNPIGARRFCDFWSRHQRYMWCRREFSRTVFFLEPLMSGAVAVLTGGLYWAMSAGPLAGVWAAIATASAHVAFEAIHLRLQGWPFSWRAPLAWIVRDWLIPVIWARAVTARTLKWQDREFKAQVA